ncbi:MAG: VanW family protein [Clostridia bacterium]|nr:VanW family protein [Clostridia bacterium]
MAAFNSGFGTGGYSFGSDDFDDPRRSRPQRQPSRPTPRSYSDFDDDFEDDFDDDFEDTVFQMRTTNSLKSASDTAKSYMERYAKLYRDDSDDYDDFDDDFDDYDRRPSQRRAQSTGSSRSTGRFFDEFEDDDDFDEMFGPRKKAVRKSARPSRSSYDDFEDDFGDDDGYYGRASMSDRGASNGGGGGVPAIFANYFSDDDMPAQSRSKKNQSTTQAQRKTRKIIITSVLAASLVLCLSALIYYLTSVQITQPLTVTSALASLDEQNSYSMLRYSVDDQLASKSFTVSLEGSTSTFRLSDYGFTLASPTASTKDTYIEVSSADGQTITQTITTEGKFTYNETLVKDFLQSVAASRGGTPMIEPSYTIKKDQLTIKAGSDGYGIDYNKFITELFNRIATDSTEPINVEMQTTVAPDVNIDEIYSEVKCTVSDAYSTTDSAGNKIYTADVVGKDFDLESARRQISAGGDSWTVTLTLTQPKVTLKELRAPDCPDLLAEFSTNFNATNKARAQNLALAANFINGLVLQPGEEFSYNDTVGERTPERGFCKATVYSGEGTDEDYGGGICQTSSTLYYTAIKCNLEITERTNHRYTVAYQDAGTDATVNWGVYDLKFKNNKEYPIKICFTVKGGTITCQIYGTEDGITAYFGFLEMEVFNWTTIYKKAQPGKNNQAPQLGKKVKTYRIVEEYGERVSKEVENVDTYLPLNKIVYTDSLPPGASYS